MKSYYTTTSLEELQRQDPEDNHPSSGLTRGIMRLVLLEVDKVATIAGLPECDDVDEARYLRALAPYLRAVKDAWSEDNQKPLGSELGNIRAGIREFARWRRTPTEDEVSEIVYRALGRERPAVVSGGDAAARRVVSAPSAPALPAVPHSEKSAPRWLPEFAHAVGENELAQRTFIVPLLNMSDEGQIRRAITAIADGRQKAKEGTGAERIVQQAQRQRKQERRGYIDNCLKSVRQILQESNDEEIAAV